jgi:hypothetical protein
MALNTELIAGIAVTGLVLAWFASTPSSATKRQEEKLGRTLPPQRASKLNDVQGDATYTF